MDPGSRGTAPQREPEQATAVTLAPRCEATPRHQRASRFLIVPSGWTLFVCLLLPSFKLCSGGAALPCVVMPPAWPPFVAGLVIGFAALEGPQRAAASARLLGRFTYTVIIGYAVLAVLAVFDGAGVRAWDGLAPAAAVALVLGWIARWCRRVQTELAVAVLAWLLALGAGLCGLGLGLSPDAVWGSKVIAVVACALVAGTSWWLVEAALRRR